MGKINCKGSSFEEGGLAIRNSLLQEEARMKESAYRERSKDMVKDELFYWDYKGLCRLYYGTFYRSY